MARTFHVDVGRGDDDNDGTSSAAPFRTIQKAAKSVQAGDEVVIHPGVYFEHVELKKKFGTAEKPIVFRANAIAKNRVVLTGANPAIRRGDSRWTLEDPELGLYSIRFRDDLPVRMLYGSVDLYPYKSLSGLKTFSCDEGPLPRHGRYYDAQAGKLFVRLHAGTAPYVTDPNRHVIAISPGDGYGFSIRGRGAAHVVLEGITFETPGIAAVYTEASFVEVRRCWFVGCPFGVMGNRPSHIPPPAGVADESASNVTVSYCDYSEPGVYADAEELLTEANLSSDRRGDFQLFWHRKHAGDYGLPEIQKYETGMVARMGRNWEIHHNYLHDAFEGLTGSGIGRSDGARVHHNLFARMCDNGIEVEDHGRDVHIYRNVFVDMLEPFSFQPLAGPPWPGPVYFYQNVVFNTSEHSSLWRYAVPNNGKGVFKIGISLKNWNEGRIADVPKSPLSSPAPGLIFFNNTVYFPGGRLFNLLGDRSVPIGNVLFANNLIYTDTPISRDAARRLRQGHFRFEKNIVVSGAHPSAEDESNLVADNGGLALPELRRIGLRDPSACDFALTPESPALGRSGELPDAPTSFSDAGALQRGDDWYPLRVGPTHDVVPIHIQTSR